MVYKYIVQCALPPRMPKSENDTFYRARLQHCGFLIRSVGNFFFFIRRTISRDPEVLSQIQII
jgi:hypothetical protein